MLTEAVEALFQLFGFSSTPTLAPTYETAAATIPPVPVVVITTDPVEMSPDVMTFIKTAPFCQNEAAPELKTTVQPLGLVMVFCAEMNMNTASPVRVPLGQVIVIVEVFTV